MSSADFNQDKTILYLDSPLFKDLTINGQLNLRANSNAIMDALKIWLVSSPREGVRGNYGGYLLPYLEKPLNNSTAELIRKNILSGLESEFQPKLTVQELLVIPDTEKKRWIIFLVAFNTELNIGINDSTFVSAQ